MGNEFQIVGAAKANDRRPFAERMSGTLSKCLSRDRRFLEGMYEVRRSQIGRLRILKCFEGQSSNFEMNSLVNWKPM